MTGWLLAGDGRDRVSIRAPWWCNLSVPPVCIAFKSDGSPLEILCSIKSFVIPLQLKIAGAASVVIQQRALTAVFHGLQPISSDHTLPLLRPHGYT